MRERCRLSSAPSGSVASISLVVAALGATLLTASVARGADADPAVMKTSSSDPCAWLAAADVTAIVGVSVAPADETSRRSGICFFPSQLVSDDGSASYAIVTPDSLPERRTFFAVAARRCGAVSTTQHATNCASFVGLARAANLDAYYAARTTASDARPIDGLGAPAVVANGVLYVRRSGRVFEIVVRRDGTIDDARTRRLATIVLARDAAAASEATRAASYGT